MHSYLNDNRPWISAAVPIDIVARNVFLSEYVRETVGRRLAYALGRFARRMLSIHVRLSDVGTPHGGDKGCQIEMRVSWHAPIFVTASDRRLDNAITKAARVAARRLDELFRRRRGA